ncbi:MAG TPA: hypothetical protein VMF65_17915 [Acidimicrobiales bacterium]|nr:hypothetical protein [Acidimicrobiales bacterium]
MKVTVRSDREAGAITAGGNLVCLQAFAERRGRDDELVLGQHGVAAGFIDLPQPLDQYGQDPYPAKRGAALPPMGDVARPVS